MNVLAALGVTVVSGLYTSLWGAFKDSPYEGLKRITFPRSIYFNVAIFVPLYFIPYFREDFLRLGLVQVFFLTMGLERGLAELYKGFFRTEDQAKYFVPTRITFFGRYIESNVLLYAVGIVSVIVVFVLLLIAVEIEHFIGFLVTAYLTGLLVAMGGAYKDAPFEGFKWLKFQRSAVVLALLSPLFYFLDNSRSSVSLGFLIYMNIGLERFTVEYYKTYIQRNMSGKFRPDLPKIQEHIDRREKFHYLALVIIAALLVLYIYEV